jgi:hypothetical protein
VRQVFAQPGHTTDEVHALLATREFVFVDCYTVTPKVGDPLRWTTGQNSIQLYPIDTPLVLKEYSARQVKVSGLTMTSTMGTEVDEQSIHLDFDTEALYYQMPWARAIKTGRLDGSTILRERSFAAAWGDAGSPVDWVGGCKMFMGRFSTVDRVGRSFADIKVKSEMVLLNMKMPRDLFQPGCNNTFGDARCKFDRDTLRIDSNVEVGSDQVKIFCSDVTDSMRLGTVWLEDLSDVTYIRTIKDVVAGSYFTLAYPLEFVPAEGMVIKLFPGCPRTYEACTDYGNTENFIGFPFLPVAETAA